MESAGEDFNDRVWLGTEATGPIEDSPWLTPTLQVGVVGGYRHRWNEAVSADDASALDSEEVTIPGDPLDIAEAMSAVWRRLRAAEIYVPRPAMPDVRPRPRPGPSLGL